MSKEMLHKLSALVSCRMPDREGNKEVAAALYGREIYISWDYFTIEQAKVLNAWLGNLIETVEGKKDNNL